MKHSKIIIVIVLTVLVGFGIAGRLSGQQQQQQQMSEEDQKMMKLWAEYSTPGKYHKYLEYFTGKWELTTKMWMKPGVEPSVEKNECEGKMILGGRFLFFDLKGTMMGMPVEGLMITGYDNYLKKFNTFWIDTTSTGVFPISGELDSTEKIRTETGVWDDFMTGKKFKVRIVTSIIDKDHYLFEMFMDDESGKEFKSMESHYTRKK